MMKKVKVMTPHNWGSGDAFTIRSTTDNVDEYFANSDGGYYLSPEGWRRWPSGTLAPVEPDPGLRTQANLDAIYHKPGKYNR